MNAFHGQPVFSPLNGLPSTLFRGSLDGWVLYYAPKYLAWTRPEDSFAFEYSLREKNFPPCGKELLDAADRAAADYASLVQDPFTPHCLTLYLNEACNLCCVYCFASAGVEKPVSLSMGAIQAALRLVADHCAERGLPLTIGFHGGGEPTLSFPQIRKSLAYANRISSEKGVGVYSYISTNGVMSEEKADWLAENITQVSLSCDGMEAIQAYNRPLKDGRSSLAFVVRSAKRIMSAGKTLQLRVTLKPQDIEVQPEIAAYLCEMFHPNRIHVELVYRGGRADRGLMLGHADIQQFLDAFITARNVAAKYGCKWILSGSRPNEIHMAYCHPFRQVLNLVPGDVASACFKVVNLDQAASQNLVIGRYDAHTDQFRVDDEHIQSFRSNYEIPDKCSKCFLAYQCSQCCPDACPANHAEDDSPLCEIAQRLAIQAIGELAAQIRPLPAGEMAGGMKIKLDQW
jgi:sulfatase maturation enzyme AslB (radical SAM superfamily)